MNINNPNPETPELTPQPHLRAWIRCRLEPVPQNSDPADWLNWCTTKGFHPVATASEHHGRRAWIPQLSSWLDNAAYLAYIDDTLAAVIPQEDADNPDICRIPDDTNPPQDLTRADPDWYHTSDPQRPLTRIEGVALDNLGRPIITTRNYSPAGCQRPDHIIPTGTAITVPTKEVRRFTRTEIRPGWGYCTDCNQMGFFTLHENSAE